MSLPALVLSVEIILVFVTMKVKTITNIRFSGGHSLNITPADITKIFLGPKGMTASYDPADLRKTLRHFYPNSSSKKMFRFAFDILLETLLILKPN